MWENIKTWFKHPFDADMDAIGWFLFFGLTIAITVLWGIVLRHLKDIA